VNFMVAKIYGLEIALIYLVNKILICDCLGMQVFNLKFSVTSPAVRNYFHVIIPRLIYAPLVLVATRNVLYSCCHLPFVFVVITNSYIQFSVNFVELNDTDI
jgi:hypothetical protein